MSEKGSFHNQEVVPPKEPKKDKKPEDTVRKLGQIATKGTQKK